jgi:hypothetical protein
MNTIPVIRITALNSVPTPCGRNQEREHPGVRHPGRVPGGARGDPDPGIGDPAGLPLLTRQGILLHHSVAAHARHSAPVPTQGAPADHH